MPYLNTDPSLPFASGSDTSRDAAIAARKFVGQQGRTVLAWFQSVQDGTQRECSEALNISRASMAARVNALETLGQLRRTDRRRAACTCYEAVNA